MALRWAVITYPYTTTTMDYIGSSASNMAGHSGSMSQWHAGNNPLSFTYDYAHGMSLRYDLTANFYITMTMTVDGSRNWRNYKIYGDNNLLYESGNQATAVGWKTDIGFVVDDANHKAWFFIIDRQGGTSSTTYYIRNAYYPTSNVGTLYPYVIAAENRVRPNWHAVNSVSGGLGTFEFSKIAQDHINDGATVSTNDPEYIERFIESTEVQQMAANIPENGEKIVMYSGAHPPYAPGNYLKLSKIGTSYYGLEFYNNGVNFYTRYITITAGHKYYLSFLIDRNTHMGALSLIDVSNNPITIVYNEPSLESAASNAMYVWLLESDDSVTPEINEEEPGGGVDPWVPDDIDPLTAPSISAIDTGFTSMFQVTKAQLQDLSDFLWTDNFVENIVKFFSDPREIIVGIAIMPVAPEVGSAMTIQAGGISTGIQGNPLTSQYKLMEDIGSVYIQKAKGNFLDYPPYTKCTVHLPFCGEHTLDVNDIMGKTLSLSYLFDFLSGSVVAAIKVDGSTNYFFGGSCGMQVPSSSEDFGRMYSSILSAGATLGTALATVATGGMTAPLAIGAGAAMANNGMNMTPEVQHTSGSGSINGMLGSQSAYITMEIPNEKLAAHQNKFSGKMSLITSKIKNCSGYIKCFKVHTDGIKATLDERKEITSYMMNGFRRETGSSLPDLTPVTSGDTVILFMKCTSEEDVMGKTWEQNTLKLEGKMVYNQNILTPEFTIKGDISAYNYAYIPLFNRYYYIKSIVALSADAMGVKFQVDALQSFKAQIDECEVILERQETKSNSRMNDPEYWTVQDKQIIPKYFRTSGGNKVKFDRNNNVFILTIAGSNARTP